MNSLKKLFLKFLIEGDVKKVPFTASSFLVISIVVLLVIGTENFTMVFLFVDMIFSTIISILGFPF